MGKVKDADENKEEIRGHRGLDARQVHFKYGAAQSDGQKADISEKIIRLPVQEGVKQHRQPSDKLSDDKG
jgi:hypothetical protein